MDIWLSKYLFVDGGIPAPVGRFFLFSGLIAHYAHFSCSEMFYRWRMCRIEAINSTAYLSTGKMMQPRYWAHCFSRASAISNIRCLWACESLTAGEVASQRDARGECGLPLVFLSSCIHTKESVANCLPTNSFGYLRPLLASRTDQRTKKG